VNENVKINIFALLHQKWIDLRQTKTNEPGHSTHNRQYISPAEILRFCDHTLTQ